MRLGLFTAVTLAILTGWMPVRVPVFDNDKPRPGDKIPDDGFETPHNLPFERTLPPE